jgi:hypothetical protein
MIVSGNMTLNEPGSRVEVHNCCNVEVDGGKCLVALPKLVLYSAFVRCTGRSVSNIQVFVCGWHTNR